MLQSADLSACALQPDRPVVVGVSGGPDSLALLHFLQSQKIPLLVASFDHQLREGSAVDTRFVGEVALQLGLPFVSDSADVAAHAVSQGLSVEEAARELRYQFLFREARKIKAQAIAVGHTADDQAETILMHFLRGAGLSGLKGMPHRVILPVFDPQIPLVRPLLSWTRLETESYCREHGLQPHIDPTNSDTRYFRNRLRHELLPYLESYNPQIRQSLARTAQVLQGDFELLNETIENAWRKTTRSIGSAYVEFDREELSKLAPSLSRNLFRKAAFLLKPGLRDVDFEALERAVSLKPVDLAGGLLTYVEGTSIFLAEGEGSIPKANWPQLLEPRPLSEGCFKLENGWVMECRLLGENNLQEQAQSTQDKFTSWLDAGLIAENLVARPYRSGDRFEPLGMPRQTTKLAELFINLKIPRRLRQHWPVVCAGEKIAWVAGLRLAETFKLTEKTTLAWRLRLYKEDGQA